MDSSEQKAVAALKFIIPLLEKYDFKWVITGGFAAHVYGADRPITDIDIDIDTTKDSANFKAFVNEIKEFITQPLEHFVDPNYDNYNLEITLNGIVVDICPMAEMNLYDKTVSKYVHFYASGFPAHEIVEWDGLKLPLLSRELIIKNIEMLVHTERPENNAKDIAALRKS